MKFRCSHWLKAIFWVAAQSAMHGGAETRPSQIIKHYIYVLRLFHIHYICSTLQLMSFSHSLQLFSSVNDIRFWKVDCCNYNFISRHFRYTVTFWPQIVQFLHSCCILDDRFSRFDTIPACGGRTDRQTDRTVISISRVSVVNERVADER